MGPLVYWRDGGITLQRALDHHLYWAPGKQEYDMRDGHCLQISTDMQPAAERYYSQHEEPPQ